MIVLHPLIKATSKNLLLPLFLISFTLASVADFFHMLTISLSQHNTKTSNYDKRLFR